MFLSPTFATRRSGRRAMIEIPLVQINQTIPSKINSEIAKFSLLFCAKAFTHQLFSFQVALII